MVVDSSALLSIILEETDRNAFLVAISDATNPAMSAANYLETAIVLLAKEREEVIGDLKDLLNSLGVRVMAVSPEQAELAADAYARFGKGRHPAALNFGDCFAYALARALDAPLLFKGTDFPQTDIRTVDLGTG